MVTPYGVLFLASEFTFVNMVASCIPLLVVSCVPLLVASCVPLQVASCLPLQVASCLPLQVASCVPLLAVSCLPLLVASCLPLLITSYGNKIVCRETSFSELDRSTFPAGFSPIKAELGLHVGLTEVALASLL